MKNKLLIIFILLPALTFPIAKEGEDLQTIENLISSTERQLAIQKELYSLMAEFQSQQDRFFEGAQTKELAAQMVVTAAKILKIAEESHLTHLFTPFFMEELKLFSGLTKKKSP